MKPIDGGPKSLNAGLKFEEEGSDGEEPQDPKTKEQENQSQIKKHNISTNGISPPYMKGCQKKAAKIGCSVWMAWHSHM